MSTDEYENFLDWVIDNYNIDIEKLKNSDPLLIELSLISLKINYMESLASRSASPSRQNSSIASAK